MSDIIAMHRADLVEAVQEAVKPLKATIAALEARCRDYLIELDHARQLLEVATANTEVDNDDAWHDAKNEWLEGYQKLVGSEKETGAERVCSHPIKEYNHHGFVSGNPNDYRCTICNTVVNFSPLQIAAWHDLRSTAKTASEPGHDEDGNKLINGDSGYEGPAR